VVARAPSLIVTLALALSLPAAATATRAALVIRGYPLAYECPRAGELDVVDRWKMDACNCTSYVAWALKANGYRIGWFLPGSMDAWNWPNVARRRGIPVGRVAVPGSVAVWPHLAPPFGHVALVTAVHGDGSFDVAEYNLPGRRPFSFDRRRRVSARGVAFLYVPRV
jgi:surface antigen